MQVITLYSVKNRDQFSILWCSKLWFQNIKLSWMHYWQKYVIYYRMFCVQVGLFLPCCTTTVEWLQECCSSRLCAAGICRSMQPWAPEGASITSEIRLSLAVQRLSLFWMLMSVQLFLSQRCWASRRSTGNPTALLSLGQQCVIIIILWLLLLLLKTVTVCWSFKNSSKTFFWVKIPKLSFVCV